MRFEYFVLAASCIFLPTAWSCGDTGHCDDTWTGAVFPEREVRAVAAGNRRSAGEPAGRAAAGVHLGVLAQAEICDDPQRQARAPYPRGPGSDRGGAPHPPRRMGRGARVELIVDGMSHEVDDCERVTCGIDGMCVKPSYVGPVRFWPPVRPQALPAIASGARLIELRVPDGVPPGERAVTVRASGDRVSPPHVVQLSLEHRHPLVLSVTNDHDGGIDIHRLGGKIAAAGLLDDAAGHAGLEPGDLDQTAHRFRPAVSTWRGDGSILPGGRWRGQR